MAMDSYIPRVFYATAAAVRQTTTEMRSCAWPGRTVCLHRLVGLKVLGVLRYILRTYRLLLLYQKRRPY